MRNLRGIIVAGVFGVLTWLVQQLAQRYSLLLDMAYPFASKTGFISVSQFKSLKFSR